MTITCRLRVFRTAHQISLRTLSTETGIAKAVLSRLETGKSGRIDFDTLNRLVAFFEREGIACTMADLLVYEPDAPAPPPAP